MADPFSLECLKVLELLKDRHNVLISGAPGTGKSRLLEEIAHAFMSNSKGPVHVPGSPVAVPADPPKAAGLAAVYPSPERTNRKVFRTVFHQSSKYRDFLTGIMPEVSGASTTFRVTEGTLYRACEHARNSSGASLLMIDEINRGPAVQVFGGSIVAMESSKRLRPDGNSHAETHFFELLSPSTGKVVEYAIPHQVYLIGAMNQADTSVEPLDVAFLRRWTPFKLEPNRDVLMQYFKLTTIPTPLPEEPKKPEDVYAAALTAWSAVNERIALGRGPEFKIGHGVFMVGDLASDLATATRRIGEAWRIIRAHVDEVFFGDVRGIAAVLGVGAGEKKGGVGEPKHPYSLADRSFADEPRLELVGPDPIPDDQLFGFLRAVAVR